MTQNVNCGLWVMTYQCRLISYNKCIILLGDVDSWGALCMCGDSLCLLPNFSVSSKNSLKST